MLLGQAKPTASGPGSYAALGGGAAAFQTDYGREHLGGAWLFGDLNPTRRLGLEAEVRWLHPRGQDKLQQSSFLVGARLPLPLVPRRLHGLAPYAKLLVGGSRITLPFAYGTGTFFTVAQGGGVDYDLSDRVTLRAVDFEYQRWLAFPYGELRPYGLSAGLSFRLNRMETLPKNARRSRR